MLAEELVKQRQLLKTRLLACPYVTRLAARLLRDVRDGVPADPIEAYKWFSLAAEQNDRKAGKNRDSVASELSSEQLREAEARVASARKPVS